MIAHLLLVIVVHSLSFNIDQVGEATVEVHHADLLSSRQHADTHGLRVHGGRLAHSLVIG